MKTHSTILGFLFILLATIATLFGVPRLEGGQEIYVADFPQSGARVGSYTLAGGTTNASLVTGLSHLIDLAVSGNQLFVLDNLAGTIGEYDATTGAAINPTLISGLVDPGAIAVSGSTLFVSTNNESNGPAKVAKYTTAGALVNAALVSGLVDVYGMAVSGSDLYVTDLYTGKVGKYTTDGATLNASLIIGLQEPNGIAVSGTDLFVASPEGAVIYKYTTGGVLVSTIPVTNGFPTKVAVSGTELLVVDEDSYSVREYTTAGALVTSSLITGLNYTNALTVSETAAPTPTPKPTPTPTPKPTPTPTPTGGLSPTTFTVDGSTVAGSGLTDTILSFAAVQTGTAAGLKVRVQSSIAGGIWTDLPNNAMTYDVVTKNFVLDTANYPTFNAISFRAIASAQGYPDSISNVVGAFSLASSKPRLSSPEIAVTGNGPFADLYFRSYVATPTSGISLRVQNSTTPAVETSWVDLNDGKAGHMLQSKVANRFYLMDNKLPAVTGVYYRVLATLTGYADALSTPFGPLNLKLDTPPTVTLIAPKAISGSGTVSSPFVYNLGSLGFVAKATMPAGGGKVEGVGMTADGELFAVSLTSTVTASYTPATIGDHVIEAIGVDSQGGMARFGTSPIYIRVDPSTSSQSKAETQAGAQPNPHAITSGNAYTQVKNNGLWTDSTTWKDSTGKSGVPGANDSATIFTFVYLAQPATVRSVTLAYSVNGNGGEILGGTPDGKNQILSTLTVTGNFACYGGAYDTIPLDSIHLILSPGAMCNFFNNSSISLPASTVDNYGTLNIQGGQGVENLANFKNYASTTFQAPLSLTQNAGTDPALDTRLLAANSVTNGGLIQSTLVAMPLGGGGSGVISNDGGSIVAQGGGNIISQDGNGIVAQGGGNIVAQGGGNIVAQGGGNEMVPPGEHAESVPSGYVQTGGETDLDGILISGPVTLNGGVLSGSGTIEGSLTNNSGYIMPGHGAGVIEVTGSFTQGANGTMVMEDGGASPDEFDQLQVAGTATLGGTLDLQLINGYKPSTADTFSPLGYTALSGMFASISSNATVTLTGSGINTTVNPAIAGPTTAASRNISTRAFVQTGENVAIAGFIVTGPAGSTKKVIVRGIGPSLSGAGVSGALADPYLQLFQGSALISSNDNWKTNAAAVIASGVPPTSDLESAIVATLAPGAYTAVLSGTNQGTGVGLIEVYDLAPDSPALLANISTRCSVQTGDNVLIGGFILQGDEPSKILVRAIGPSLTAAGVTGALADPILELYDANGDVLENDDWQNTQEADIVATGVPPTNSKESAILATLPPGAYTAIVMGKNGGTGVALVEVYNIR